MQQIDEHSLDVALGVYLKTIGEGVRKVDISRQVLCEQSLFDPYACFQILDKDRKGYISTVDMMRFLEYSSAHLPLIGLTRSSPPAPSATESFAATTQRSQASSPMTSNSFFASPNVASRN